MEIEVKEPWEVKEESRVRTYEAVYRISKYKVKDLVNGRFKDEKTKICFKNREEAYKYAKKMKKKEPEYGWEVELVFLEPKELENYKIK